MLRILVSAAIVLGVLVAPDTALAQGTETVVYFHTDAIGSVRLITDANGQEVERFDHAPFGEPWPAPSTTEGPRFAWSEHDPATGLNYLSARDLQSPTGRFTAVDPGHVGGNLVDPQSWNGYAYARNNPLRFIDPDGRQAQTNNCPVIPGIQVDDCVKVSAPDPLVPYLPSLTRWLNEPRPNYPGTVIEVPSSPGQPTGPTRPVSPIVDGQCAASLASLAVNLGQDALFLFPAGAALRFGVAGARQIAAANRLAQQIGPRVTRGNVFAQIFVRSEAHAGATQLHFAAGYGGLAVGEFLSDGIVTGILDSIPLVASIDAFRTAAKAC